MHLYGEVLDAYVARRLNPRELGAADLHVSNCLSCTQMIAEMGLRSGSWERRGWLGRLVLVDEPAVEATTAESLSPSIA
jgi:hypothetical protein